MKYKIIKDEVLLRKFISWLPLLGTNEKFYVSLFARKKYCPDVPHLKDRSSLKRFVSDSYRLYDKIKQLENIEWKIKGQVVPQETLAVYIHPNPRCMTKASYHLIKVLLNRIENYVENINVVQEALTSIQKSPRKIYLDFDIDSKEEVPDLSDLLVSDCYKILETKGGYHILVRTKRATSFNKQIHKLNPDLPKEKFPLNWYGAIKQRFDIDAGGDLMIPIPGCTQGNFIPKFIQ